MMRTMQGIAGALALVSATVCGASPQSQRGGPEPQAAAAQEPALKNVFARAFMMGAALNENQFSERDGRGAELVKRHSTRLRPRT